MNTKTSERKPLVVVLGAGATRACSFVDSKKFTCVPPLDSDFFTQLQRVPDHKHRDLVTAIVEDTVDLFGHNFALTLEAAFTTVEHSLRMLEATRSSSAKSRKKELKDQRDRLLSALAMVLEASLAERNGGRPTHEAQDCKNHQKLVCEVLQQGDAVISFNYDCMIDDALRRHGAGKWNARYGYGFKLGPRGADLKGDDYWCPRVRNGGPSASDKDSTIRVHKLHGSLHFRFEEPSDRARRKTRPSVVLKSRPYTKQRGTPRFSIIPPESSKAYDEGLFAGLWRGAAQSLSGAKHLVVIGYSFPATDLHSASLFRNSLKPESLRSLVVVNPDPEARRRAREVMRRGFSTHTRVLSFDSMDEFLATQTTVWRE